MKRLLTLLFLVVATGTIVNAQDGPAKIEVQKIWNEAPHSAFTSLVRFKNQVLLHFQGSAGPHIRSAG
jgi:hypothetical protein